jgi:hypothetical protein
VGLLQRLVAFFRAEPDDERILLDADQHVAVQQETDAAEHLFLLDAPPAGQGLANTLGQRCAEGQRSLLSHRGSPTFKQRVFYRDGKKGPHTEEAEGC